MDSIKWKHVHLFLKTSVYCALLFLLFFIADQHDSSTGGDEISFIVKSAANLSASRTGDSKTFDLKQSMRLFEYGSETENTHQFLDEQFKTWPWVFLVIGLIALFASAVSGAIVLLDNKNKEAAIAWQISSCVTTLTTFIFAIVIFYLTIHVSIRAFPQEMNFKSSLCGLGSLTDNVFVNLPLLGGNERTVAGLDALNTNSYNPNGVISVRHTMLQIIDEVTATDATDPTNLQTIGACLNDLTVTDQSTNNVLNVYREKDALFIVAPALVAVMKQQTAQHGVLADDMIYRFGSSYATVHPSEIGESFNSFSNKYQLMTGFVFLLLLAIVLLEVVIAVQHNGQLLDKIPVEGSVPGGWLSYVKIGLVVIHHVTFFIGVGLVSKEFESDSHIEESGFYALRTEITILVVSSSIGTAVALLSAGVYALLHVDEPNKCRRMLMVMVYVGEFFITLTFGLILFFYIAYTTDHANDTAVTPGMRKTMADLFLMMMIPASVMYTAHEFVSEHKFVSEEN